MTSITQSQKYKVQIYIEDIQVQREREREGGDKLTECCRVAAILLVMEKQKS